MYTRIFEKYFPLTTYIEFENSEDSYVKNKRKLFDFSACLIFIKN